MADVLMSHTPDGGEVTIEGGQFTLTEGIETAVYLSLFGGNQRDSGADGDKPRTWWGNVDEPDPAKRYRSETGYLLKSIPPTPANLKRIEDAVGRDLAWMVESGTAAAVTIDVRMPALNTVRIAIGVEIAGLTHPVLLNLPWRHAS